MKGRRDERVRKEAAGPFPLTNAGRNDMAKKGEAARANLYVFGMVR
jgi:hypothetical protein